MRKTVRPFLAATCVLAAVGVIGSACGGSSDDGASGGAGAPAQPVAQADFADKLADAICSNVKKCCTNHGYAFDPTTCSSSMKAIGQKSIDSGSTLSGVTYDATAAGNCVWQWQAIAASCVADTQGKAALTMACNGTWSGTKSEGQSCADDRECAGFAQGSVACVAGGNPSGDAGLQSICAKITPGAHGVKGDPCGGTCETTAGGGETCSGASGAPAGAKTCWVSDGLYCDVTKYQCAELIAQGQPCTAVTTCVASAYCTAGICTPRIATGSGCEASGLADPCESGAWCNASSKSCDALKADGEACTSYLECKSNRCNAGKCIPESAAASEGLCGSK